MLQKIVNKSKTFSKHGQHKGMAQEIAKRNREHNIQHRIYKMYNSVHELFHRVD